MELIKVAEEAEGEAGLKFAVWDGAPNWNDLEALNGGTERHPLLPEHCSAGEL